MMHQTRKNTWFIVTVSMFFLLCSSSLSKASAEPEHPQLRALLLACDQYISREDMSPAAVNNVEAMKSILTNDIRIQGEIHTSVNQKMDKSMFSQLIRSAFEGAAETDIAWIYLFGHGIYETLEEGEFHLLLGDGEEEYMLSMEELYTELKEIPGTKVLIIDACNSGASINKGLVSKQIDSVFHDEHFKVLTSAGGLEQSYTWSSVSNSQLGGSYFMMSLMNGISREGGYCADLDRDGNITLQETYEFLLRHYGLSTPHVYPQRDDFALISHRADQGTAVQRIDRLLVTDLVFEQTTLSREQNTVEFSYTLNQTARIAYHLIYEKDGEWQFQQPQVIEDYENEDGTLLPGRKEKELVLNVSGRAKDGYVLLMIVAVNEDEAVPYSCDLLSVQELYTDEQVDLTIRGDFTNGTQKELRLEINHRKPCSVSVYIKNEKGQIVANPFIDFISRPSKADSRGTLLYYDGKDDQGNFLSKGNYRIEVEYSCAGQSRYLPDQAFSVE